MRIIRPQDFEQLKKTKSSTKKPRTARLLVIIFMVMIVFGGTKLNNQQRSNDTGSTTKQASKKELNNSSDQQNDTKSKLKIFTGAEFMALAIGTKYPNTQAFDVLPSITGNAEADDRIRKLAEERGYRLTSIPVSPIEKLNEPRLGGDDLLQPLAAQGWRDLKAAARRDGEPLSVISAYRSPEYQRTMFGQRLSAAGATVWGVSQGLNDTIVNTVLGKTAVPGFSRHHTGYTIDLWCEDGSGAFVFSSCFDWISKDNYKAAKLTGWIPSYPDGAELQGPEPEPWEYVWVGTDVLYE
jgi:LAS superfamily LD-carboxypeptidase LdcB